jgi:hypothetical protein
VPFVASFAATAQSVGLKGEFVPTGVTEFGGVLSGNFWASTGLGSSSWLPPVPARLWCRLCILQQSGAGSELGAVFFLSQFSLGCGDLLFRFCESGLRAADLRDEFLKGGAVHCCLHPRSTLGAQEDSRKVNQRLTLSLAGFGVNPMMKTEPKTGRHHLRHCAEFRTRLG